MLFKLTLSAIAFELGALGLLFLQSSSVALILAYMGLHGVACALSALAINLVIPAQYRRPRNWLLGYLFCFNFFMPVVGILCATLGILIAVWWPHRPPRQDFDTTTVPRFTTHRNHEGTGFRGGQIRAQLNNDRAPLNGRLKALVAVQDTPARTTGNLLRELLADPTDDVRLLAYGILDGKEKQITQRILHTRNRLQRGVPSGRAASLHKRIAELYWELIYQNLVQGDMRDFSAQQVREHAAAAQVVRIGDAGIWFLLGRLELQMRDIAAAEVALQQAQVLGFARERLLPYLAELRFQQHRYADVRALFRELIGVPGVPALLPVRHYWLVGAGQSQPSQVVMAANTTVAPAIMEGQYAL